MLYIGNFSYNDDSDDADNYCLMPCLVKAESTEQAMDRFADMLERMKHSSDLLEGAHEVYLDSLVELEDEPEEAIVTQWQKIVPKADGLCSITTALPEAEFGTAYGWGDEEGFDDADEAEQSADDDDSYEEEEVDEEPFVTFE